MASTPVVLVTGANGGIGYETVKALLRSTKPHQILLGSRSLDKGNKAIESLRTEVPETKNQVELLQVDLASDASIEAAAENVKSKYGRLDTLINNAGATFDLDFIDNKVSLRESFNMAYDVNVAGTNVMTWNFIPLLLKSTQPRLIFVSGLSSIMKAVDENWFPTPEQPAGWPKKYEFDAIGYRCSKVALNMLMLDWHHKLKADGIKIWAVLPGFLATNLGNRPGLGEKMGAGHASIGGEFLRTVAEGERDADSGRLIQKSGLGTY